MTLEEKKRLLAVLAHPDDESFGMGGTLALYSQRGVEVHLVCATRGEVGDVAPEFMEGFESVAALREAELKRAAEELGLSGVHFLDYRDSGMPGTEDNHHPRALAAQPVEAVAEKVAHFIRLLQPQVVVTFDPIGGYHHPDHIAIQRATVQAFRVSGDPAAYPEESLAPYRPQKLYFHTFPKGFLRIAVRVLRLLGRDPSRFGRNQDIDLASLVEEGSFPTHAKINVRPALRRRDAAAGCHASQLGGGPPNRGLVSWMLRLFAGYDHFMRAYPEPEPGLREKDLFEGVELE